MRMVQWLLLPVFVLPLAACDDSAGQPAEPTTPPRLTRITIQDVRALLGNPSPVTGFVQRNSVVDLLDSGAPQACSDTQPCVGQYTIDYTSPDFSCVKNACSDPLRVPAAGVPLSVPVVPTRGDAGSGMAIRIVFDKLLDGSIETVTSDPTKPPGQTLSYALAGGIAELDDASGAEVPTQKLYDNSGSPTFSSDIMIAPFGPAIVLKPIMPLEPATTYTIKLPAPSRLVDRSGRAAVGPDGNAFGASYSISFTTEPLTANPAGSFPDFTTSPTKIAPNQIVQFAFWEPIDETTAQVTMTGPSGVAALAYADRGGDATMCAAVPWLLDVVNAPGGTPADWPAGDYTLSLTVKDASGKSSLAVAQQKLTVAGSATAMDPLDWKAHVAPAQCSK